MTLPLGLNIALYREVLGDWVSSLGMGRNRSRRGGAYRSQRVAALAKLLHEAEGCRYDKFESEGLLHHTVGAAKCDLLQSG